MTMSPEKKAKWSNALLLVAIALSVLSTLLLILARTFWSIVPLYGSVLLLFGVSILFAVWKDWRRAFWASFTTILWAVVCCGCMILMLLLLPPR